MYPFFIVSLKNKSEILYLLQKTMITVPPDEEWMIPHLDMIQAWLAAQQWKRQAYCLFGD
jgi:hypothetical protein